MCRPTPKTNFTKCLPIIILFFTALRILAGLRIPYMILADQRYDDRMLFENAYDLLSGVWLGSYDAYALAKGIGYPMFLVLAKKLCLPYSVLLALLQAVGAWLFVRALSVRWKNPYGQTLLYLLLLFSPISLTQLVTQRLYRMAIVPGMVLVVFSGMIGLTLRKELPLKKQLPWAVLTGMALAFFWQIREDSVWILPFIAVMTVWNVGYVILALHKKRTGRQLSLRLLHSAGETARSGHREEGHADARRPRPHGRRKTSYGWRKASHAPLLTPYRKKGDHYGNYPESGHGPVQKAQRS